MTSPPADDNFRALVIADAYDRNGRRLAHVELTGGDPYVFTGDILAWSAARVLGHGVNGTGALGPVDGFGLDALRDGCAETGLIAS
ncbi:hypothetical protein D5S17_03950 [Pseudonocardiaceae bacterium YIM PH 21723]|nr:hypothetical protein D5S17_03950 [Pseudonocardiaceae bacterium YIM PH 21723]